MHYRVNTFNIGVENGNAVELNFTQFQFVETLFLEQKELLELEVMLRRLKHEMGRFFFNLAQDNPEVLDEYKVPNSVNDPDHA